MIQTLLIAFATILSFFSMIMGAIYEDPTGRRFYKKRSVLFVGYVLFSLSIFVAYQAGRLS